MVPGPTPEPLVIVNHDAVLVAVQLQPLVPPLTPIVLLAPLLLRGAVGTFVNVKGSHPLVKVGASLPMSLMPSFRLPTWKLPLPLPHVILRSQRWISFPPLPYQPASPKK